MNAVVKAEVVTTVAALTPIYDKMVAAVTQCVRIDEAKELHNQAMALEVYARQARNTETEEMCARVRIRAERKMGELLAEMKASGEMDSGMGGDRKSRSSDTTVIDQPKTLSDLGITKDQSAKSQKLAQIPPTQFEEALSQPKPSVSKILKDTDPDRNAKPKKKVADVVYMQTRLTAQAQAQAENYRQSGATRPKSTLWQ